MRGRKFNSEFLSDFICECIQKNQTTTDEILQEAKKRVNDINDKILEVEKLKLIRADFLDIISTFEKPNKPNKEDEKLGLSFFNIHNPIICKFICDTIKVSPTKISQLYDKEFDKQEIIFCLKQLLEHKVVTKRGDFVLRGEFFLQYMSFVFKET